MSCDLVSRSTMRQSVQQILVQRYSLIELFNNNNNNNNTMKHQTYEVVRGAWYRSACL